VVETGGGQVQAEGVLPVDAGTDRIRCLPVRKVLGEREDRDQGQPPRRCGGLTTYGKQVREILVPGDSLEVVVHPGVGGAGGKGGAGDPGRFIGHRFWRVRAE